ARDPIFVADSVTGILIDCNIAAAKLVERERCELVGEHQRILHPQNEHVGEYTKTFIEHIGEKEGQIIESQIITKTGEIRDVEIKANLFELDDKKLIQGLFRDITDQKRMREEFHRSEYEKKAILNAISDPLSLHDRDRRFIWMNDALLDVAGASRDKLLGKRCYEGVFGLNSPHKGCPVNKVFETGRSEESRIEIPDGRVWEIHGQPIFDESGDIFAVLERITDITNIIQYERKLESLHKHASELTTSETIKDVTEKTFEAIEKTLGFEHGGFGVIEGGVLHFSHMQDIKNETLELPLDGRGITIRAIRTGETQLVPDIREDKDYVPGSGESLFKTLSELDIPVKIDGEVVAVINVESAKLAAFTNEDVRLLEIFAEHVALVLSRIKYTDNLRTSEKQYRSLLEASRDAVFVITEGKFVYVNQRTVELMGYSSAEELLEADSLDTVAPEDRDRAFKMIRGRPMDEGLPVRYEIRLLRKDGKILDVENHVSLIEFEGKPASLVFTRDITDRKRMEKDLRESEKRYRNLIELAPDGIVSIDLKGYVKTINEAFSKHTGFPPEEIIDRHITKIATIRAQDLPRALKLFGLFVQGKTYPPLEFIYKRKDGSTGWGEAHAQMVEIEEGKKEILVILREISDRKQMEEELHRHTDKLEEVVGERTRELLDAERLSAAGRVAAMVGHDLRSPLQAIRNSTYLMKRTPDNTEQMLDTIERNVDRAVEMLERFRTQTREEPLKIETSDLTALINRAVEETGIPSSVEITLELQRTLDDIPLDPGKIRRVLDNLIQNAVEAMPEGGSLTIEGGLDEGGLTLRVTDTGTGIPEEDIQNLFTPFHTTKPKGMGLGLAYCRRAVEAHGGTITAQSQEGAGTTFTIRLPTQNKPRTV
ncbi:MAG: PAS domain S-box protein, partial [Candidatus Bathyarchaeota archaeon]